MAAAPRPYTLVAELTYRCPLRCAYCSNPTDLTAHADELETLEWLRVLTEAEALGVMAVNITGGEPLLRHDLESIVTHARELGLYTSLITSGVPLERDRLSRLVDAGLEHVQLSVQDVDEAAARRVAGVSLFDAKVAVAGWVRDAGISLTLNVVLHAENVARTPEFIALAERLGADRLELAHTQYLGWALENRGALLPTRADVEASRAVAHSARERLRGRMEVSMVLPDYFAGRPRACMDGWGRRFLVVSPGGLALPCHAAHTIPGLAFASVRDRPLAEIFATSPGLERYRGEAWMPEPCASCDRRTIDYGGCRCQAFHLLGDAARTDPACALSPDHDAVTTAVERATAVGARPGIVLRGTGPRRLTLL
jgi:pyrroloquinoline quinone biosynthesis protein E